jgi:hypothetical protein
MANFNQAPAGQALAVLGVASPTFSVASNSFGTARGWNNTSLSTRLPKPATPAAPFWEGSGSGGPAFPATGQQWPLNG